MRKAQKYRSKTGKTYYNDEEEPPVPEEIKELDRLLYVTNRTLLQYRPNLVQPSPIKLDDFTRPIDVAKPDDAFSKEINRVRGPLLVKGEAFPLTEFTIQDGNDFSGSPDDNSSEAAPYFFNTIERTHRKAQSHILRQIVLGRDYDEPVAY